jgi:peroxiredoxin
MSGLIVSAVRRKYREHTLHIFIVTGLLIGSTLLNVFQARKVGQLRHTIAALKSEGQLLEGSSVPSIDARDANRNSAKLTYVAGGPSTVLYVFSPQCGWCNRNLASVKTLAKSINGSYRFATISLSEDKLQEYMTQKDFQFPVYAGLSINTARAYKFGGTPQTLVISSDGHVQKNWMGAYMGETKREIETYFNVQLPDLPQNNN